MPNCGGVLLDSAGVIQVSLVASIVGQSAGWQSWPLASDGTVCTVAEAAQARVYNGGFSFDSTTGRLITDAVSAPTSFVRGVAVTATGAVCTAAAGSAIGFAESIALATAGKAQTT